MTKIPTLALTKALSEINEHGKYYVNFGRSYKIIRTFEPTSNSVRYDIYHYGTLILRNVRLFTITGNLCRDIVEIGGYSASDRDTINSYFSLMDIDANASIKDGYLALNLDRWDKTIRGDSTVIDYVSHY